METTLSPHALHRCVRSAGSGFNCRGPATLSPKIIRAAAPPHSLKYSFPLFVFLMRRFGPGSWEVPVAGNEKCVLCPSRRPAYNAERPDCLAAPGVGSQTNLDRKSVR